MRSGISLLGMDEMGELGRVPQEEDRGVVGWIGVSRYSDFAHGNVPRGDEVLTDKVPVAFWRSELDCESTRVPGD